MDVVLLWFKCKNPNCGYIPYKTKKDKVKKVWRHGYSLQSMTRQRMFLKYVEGYYIYKDNGDNIIFHCKYGEITIFHRYDEDTHINSYAYPIEDSETCQQCIDRLKNERSLFQ